ncbi:MAG: hypothetical protein HQK52_17860 [Oligoflexia bacterium]|nr:hypothetical protein [Oligoflexia bacterium]
MPKEFPAIVHAYNDNISNLTEAKKIFQQEVNQFIKDELTPHLEKIIEQSNKEMNAEKRISWSLLSNQINQTKKEGNWTSYWCGVDVEMYLKRNKNFQKGAKISFAIEYFEKLHGRFMFYCYLENLNKAMKNLDEEIYHLTKNDRINFPNAKKQNDDTAYLFITDISGDLYEKYPEHIKAAFNICEKATEKLLLELQDEADTKEDEQENVTVLEGAKDRSETDATKDEQCNSTKPQNNSKAA